MTTTATFEKSIRYDRETRDYRAELDGQLIGYYPNYHAAEVALDQVAYDLLADGAALAATALDGGNDADAMLKGYSNRLEAAGPVCVNCGAYGHLSIDCPYPPLPRPAAVAADPEPQPAPTPWPGPGPNDPPILFPVAVPALLAESDAVLRVNWSDRERCPFCCGPHAADACPLRRPVFVGAPQACANCGQAHHIQRCPEVWAALRAAGPDTGLSHVVAVLHAAQRELVELRAAGLHSAAASRTGDALNTVESWLTSAPVVSSDRLAA